MLRQQSGGWEREAGTMRSENTQRLCWAEQTSMILVLIES